MVSKRKHVCYTSRAHANPIAARQSRLAAVLLKEEEPKAEGRRKEQLSTEGGQTASGGRRVGPLARLISLGVQVGPPLAA